MATATPPEATVMGALSDGKARTAGTLIDPAARGQSDPPANASYPVQVVAPAAGKKSNTVNFTLTAGPAAGG